MNNLIQPISGFEEDTLHNEIRALETQLQSSEITGSDQNMCYRLLWRAHDEHKKEKPNVDTVGRCLEGVKKFLRAHRRLLELYKEVY